MASCFLHFLINDKGIEKWIHNNQAHIYTHPFTCTRLSHACALCCATWRPRWHQPSCQLSVLPMFLSQQAHTLHHLQLLGKAPLPSSLETILVVFVAYHSVRLISPWLPHVADGNMALCPHVLPGHTMRRLAASSCCLLLKWICMAEGRGMHQILCLLFISYMFIYGGGVKGRL